MEKENLTNFLVNLVFKIQPHFWAGPFDLNEITNQEPILNDLEQDLT